MTILEGNFEQLHSLARQLGVPNRLHDYQWEGINFLLHNQSALLADEMGLGKTVQAAVALAFILEKPNDINRALIVAPAPLVVSWMQELKTWAPSLTARRLIGNSESRQAMYLLPIPVVVGSYEQIRLDSFDRIPSDTFDLVLLDEAQRVKNRQSSVALACRLLPRKISWALSATPLENNSNELASVLSFLDSSIGLAQSKLTLTSRLKSTMLRRRKLDVRSDLPPIILQDLVLELLSPQREQYNALWVSRTEAVSFDESQSKVNTALLGIITKLKIICNYAQDIGASVKFDAFNEIIEGAGSNARILVFSQFVRFLRWISSRLDIPHDLFVGGMSEIEQKSAIDSFRTGSTPRVLLASMRAGGVGLNLGEASHVVLMDRWWNPAVEIQAIHRAHRFERDQPLHVIRFLVKDTIEERIASILEEKKQLFIELVDTGGMKSYKPPPEDLIRILDLSRPPAIMSARSDHSPEGVD